MDVLEKAKHVLLALGRGDTPQCIRSRLCQNEDEWDQVSAEAYRLHLEKAREQRAKDEAKSNVACTSNEDVAGILALNGILADLALCLPPESTMADYRNLRELVTGARPEEQRVLLAIEDITMSPRMRALQQKGRFDVFPIFRGCASIIEAGVISYFRGNYISAYLTLVPVIEGVTLRWMGYTGRGKKPDFKKIKRFIASSYRRQPCPGNPLFHEVYVNVADKILREHLFRPSGEGDAHSHFNRHLAAHLLSNSHFGTRENCVRLCLLLDVMSELYIYETYCQDPRFYLRGKEIQKEYDGYVQAFINRADSSAPERTLLLAKNANNHFGSNYNRERY